MSYFLFMNAFCYHLKLPIQLDTVELDKIKKSYKNTDSYSVFDIQVDTNIVRYLKGHFDILVTFGEVFYTPPHGKLPIHIDVYGDEITKMNWVFGAQESEMIWYDVLDKSKPLNKQITPIGTPYVLYEPEDCVKIYSDRINNPSIVNAAIPHGIENFTDKGRWCVSYVLLDNFTGEKLKWVEAVRRFKNFF